MSHSFTPEELENLPLGLATCKGDDFIDGKPIFGIHVLGRDGLWQRNRIRVFGSAEDRDWYLEDWRRRALN